MKKTFQYFVLVLSAAIWISCDDEFTHDIVKDNKPEVPVTFTGATTYGFNPFYTVSITGDGTIAISMEIPEASGHSIKQIRKITAGGTGLTPGSLLDATAAYASNINVNATTVTFTTTLTEFNGKMSAANKVAAPIAANTFVERAFMFAITLDDDTEIIPVQCRIRFVP